MKIAIVDDEVHWREEVKVLIEKYFGIDVPTVDVYVNGESFLHANAYYDLLFLDIEMERIDGFEVAREYKEKYPYGYVILLTTHTEFVTKGYEVNAFRYIYKDLMTEEIPRAIRDYQTIKKKERTILVNEVGVGMIPIHIKDIISVKVNAHRNCVIHTRTRDYITSQGLHHIEDELLSCGFFRSHKSFLVNLCEVDTFDKRDIIMKDKSIAYMSSRKYADFKAAYLNEKMKMSNG